MGTQSTWGSSSSPERVSTPGLTSNMPAALPTVVVQGSADTVQLPEVFLSPIRPDIVNAVHTGLNKNNRQPYAVNKRAGQGAFGNMCRGGRMFAPTKTWRRWHRRVNLKQKRYAVCSALAASAVPSLLMARGHHVENVPEVPLVISND